MDTLTAIMTRRSIREYTEEPVSRNEVNELLAAAMAAPSAGNSQCWQFVVIDDETLKRKIPEINPYAVMIKKAPVGVLVCGDLRLEKAPGFWVQDCSAAIQNMLLAAHALGLGAVWTGIHPVEERVRRFRELLKLPDHIMPLGLVVIGRPNQTLLEQDRFDPKKIRYNVW